MGAWAAAPERATIADWYARVQARPAFPVAVSDWLPEPLLAVFRTGGEEVWERVEPMTRGGG